MNLYIKVLDGKIIDHPVLEENLKQVYPQFDPEHLPHDYVLFKKSNSFEIQAHQTLEGPFYRINGNYVEDYYIIKNPPIPYPTDGQLYYWDFSIKKWVLSPEPPKL